LCGDAFFFGKAGRPKSASHCCDAGDFVFKRIGLISAQLVGVITSGASKASTADASLTETLAKCPSMSKRPSGDFLRADCLLDLRAEDFSSEGFDRFESGCECECCDADGFGVERPCFDWVPMDDSFTGVVISKQSGSIVLQWSQGNAAGNGKQESGISAAGNFDAMHFGCFEGDDFGTMESIVEGRSTDDRGCELSGFIRGQCEGSPAPVFGSERCAGGIAPSAESLAEGLFEASRTGCLDGLLWF
jgi:hypothetical protein